MNDGWRFHFGDLAERNFNAVHGGRFDVTEWIKAGNNGAAMVGYPDEDWRRVDLPHDFIHETGDYREEHNRIHGSLPTGVGWYRKTFHVPAEDEGKRLSLEFDGVFRDSQVWVNGHFAGRHLSGYTGFAYDITDLLNYGEANSIAVRADATLFELWSYEGGGIYRDVRLVKTDPVHVGHWGTFVRAELSDDHTSAGVVVDTTVKNDAFDAVRCTVRAEVLNGDAVVLSLEGGLEVDAFGEAVSTLTGRLDKPRLWSCDDPHRYTLRTTVLRAGEVVDQTETPFGVRSFRFDADTGFYLNGESVKLKGVCQHQDHAGVGVAIPEAVERYRVDVMKAMGVNAIRTSHNPPSPQLLELCDELGVLVMDEVRMPGTSEEALGQLEDLILRDRNHACVFLWSVGNEEAKLQPFAVGIRVFRRMQHRCHQLDPTRKVTYAMNAGWDRVSVFHDEQGFRFDVFGGNYVCYKGYEVDGRMYDAFHERFPDWPMLGSETGGSASTRGLYLPHQDSAPLSPGETHLKPWMREPKRETFVSAYGETCTPWGYSVEQTWIDCLERPFMCGTFLWTGMDYRGEIYPADWPNVVTCYGLTDLCGFGKDAYHYYRVHWNEEPGMHLFPHWSWSGHDGEVIDVWCYAACAEVELSLNGRSLGRQAMPTYRHVEWAVPFEPGVIEAVGYSADGKEVLRQRHVTAGAPAAVTLSCERTHIDADGRDVAVVTVSAEDADGNPVPVADDMIHFEVTGPAVLLGVGNGDPASHEPDKADHRRLFNGLAQVLVQATREPGEVVLRARAEGMRDATLSLRAAACEPLPWIASLDEATEQEKVETEIDNAL
ncbi:MAG: beta-galactosidase GalA [Planctomycetota bacterium]